MRKFELSTPYGDRYFIHDNGNIERTDMHFAPSGQWKLVGLASTKGYAFGQMVVMFENLSEWLTRNPVIHYKNGNPRYTVIDLDHGTHRTWGNTKYHGVASITEVL